MNTDRFFKQFSISITALWLGIFALLPLVLCLGISFLTHDETHFFKWPIDFHNYIAVFNPIYFHIFLRSIWMAICTTALCLLIAYPFAYLLAQLRPALKPFFLCLMIIPFWTSSIIRIYAMIAFIKTRGVLNTVLLHLGIIHQPLHLLFSQTAVFIGLVYNLLPYMILPIYANIEKLDWHLVDAAKDLGASSRSIFAKIILPLTMPGILAGTILVFLPTMTLFYIPDLLGGARSMLLGNLITTQILTLSNWPLGCATSMVLTLIMLILFGIYQQTRRKKPGFGA